MKKLIYLLVSFFVLFSCKKDEEVVINPLLGTWELYDFKDVHDGVIQDPVEYEKAYYDFSDNRFTCVLIGDRYENGYSATKNIKYSIVDDEFLIQKNGYFYLRNGKIFHETADTFRVETITYYGEMLCVEKRYFRRSTKKLDSEYPVQVDFSSDTIVAY